ncbi:MAG: AI-2E family transporter [Gammaproteobacteria bacterium]|nr:AI-2E family transporter [Gammaproteobacteria bacterium]
MTDAQKWLMLACIFLGAWLLYLLAPVLTPFLIAGLLAYLGDPLVDRLELKKLSRSLAVVLVFAVMLFTGLLLLLILIPALQQQLIAVLSLIPRVVPWLQEVVIPWVSATFDIRIENIGLDALQNLLAGNWQDIGNLLGMLLGKIGHSGQLVFAWLAYLVLVPVVTFYLLRDWDLLVQQVRDLIPRKIEPLVSKLTMECDQVLAEFLRGQLLLMMALAVMYSIGLWLAGLEFALLVGMLSGLVSFVPYLGAIVGIGVAGVLAFMQFQDFIHLFYVALVFGIGQSIEGMLLSPILVGDRIGLHPVAVIFAVMAGAQLFGFFGVLLALPVAAIIVVLLRHLRSVYTESSFYTL